MNPAEIAQLRVFSDYLESSQRPGARPNQTYVEQVQRWLEQAEASLKDKPSERGVPFKES